MEEPNMTSIADLRRRSHEHYEEVETAIHSYFSVTKEMIDEYWDKRERKEFYQKIKYSDESQADKLVEELAELIQAIIKYRFHPNKRKRRINLIEEFADVEIMLEQMKMRYDIEAEVEHQKDNKISSLKQRLKI